MRPQQYKWTGYNWGECNNSPSHFTSIKPLTTDFWFPLIFRNESNLSRMQSKKYALWLFLSPSNFGLDRGLETPDFLLNQRLAFSVLHYYSYNSSYYVLLCTLLRSEVDRAYYESVRWWRYQDCLCIHLVWPSESINIRD